LHIPLGSMILIPALHWGILAGILVLVHRHCPTTPRHIWQYGIGRKDDQFFQDKGKTHMRGHLSTSFSPCYRLSEWNLFN
jgi:hypothetical protein